MMRLIKEGNHTYIYRNGEMVYKRWDGPKGKTQPSLLCNVNGWPHEWIT